jgi:hypothetical protein
VLEKMRAKEAAAAEERLAAQKAAERAAFEEERDHGSHSAHVQRATCTLLIAFRALFSQGSHSARTLHCIRALFSLCAVWHAYAYACTVCDVCVVQELDLSRRAHAQQMLAADERHADEISEMSTKHAEALLPQRLTRSKNARVSPRCMRRTGSN